jgi:CHAD domain-containing protein
MADNYDDLRAENKRLRDALEARESELTATEQMLANVRKERDAAEKRAEGLLQDVVFATAMLPDWPQSAELKLTQAIAKWDAAKEGR